MEGRFFEEKSRVQEQVVQFYKSLYTELENWQQPVDEFEFASIEENDKHLLERQFEKDEVLQVLKDLEGDKAPVLGGFTIAFFEHCYRLVEADVMAIFCRIS